jgi:hypothetical protein
MYGPFAFSGFAAVVMLYKIGDPRGLLLNRVIELSPFGADIFYGTLFLISAFAAGFSGYAIIRSFGEKLFLTLDSQAITGPRYYGLPGMISLRYSQIATLKRTAYDQHRGVIIEANDGRKIRIGTANFLDAGQWPEFIHQLERRMGHSDRFSRR